MSAQVAVHTDQRRRAATRRRLFGRHGDGVLGLAFVIPSFFLFLLFTVYPLYRTVTLSFTNWDGVSPHAQNVGLKNYRDAMHDHLWWVSMYHGLFFVVTALIFMNGSGLLLAIAVDRVRRGQGAYRIVFYIPTILSGVVVAVIWKWILQPSGGPLNEVLHSLGLDSLQQPWLASSTTAIWSVAVASMWTGLGYPFLFYLAGLQNVPAEQVEAARIDGARGWNVFKDVTLPSIRHVITLVNILTILGGMQIFNVVITMTNGGPSYATEVPLLHIYREAFTYLHFGYATALSVIFGLMLLVVSIVQFVVTHRKEHYS
jgi:raffinose/stachyose/melibiose transport system permease protein